MPPGSAVSTSAKAWIIIRNLDNSGVRQVPRSKPERELVNSRLDASHPVLVVIAVKLAPWPAFARLMET